MIVSRVVALFLRFAQFVCAAIVLGLTAFFLHQRRKYGVGPLGRTVYAVVVSAISIIISVVNMIPTTSSIINYVSDFFWSAAWFAVFGLFVSYFDDITCGSIWAWEGIRFRGNNTCGQWNAAQAFSFLSAIFWLASCILGVITYHRLSRHPVATDGTTRHRRWPRRSRV